MSISTYEVVHSKVAIRQTPSTNAPILGVLFKGVILEGNVRSIGFGEPWLRLSDKSKEDAVNLGSKVNQEMWVLIHGQRVGLGQLLRELSPAEIVAKVKAKQDMTERSAGNFKNTQKQVGNQKRYRVVHRKVVVRKGPSIDEALIGFYSKGDIRLGIAQNIGGVQWLQVEEGWMLIDGKIIGLGRLLEEAGKLETFAERLTDMQEQAQKRLDEEVKLVEKANATEEEVASDLWQGCPVPLWLPWVPQSRRGPCLKRTASSIAVLEWMAKKTALKQDLFLLGPPGSTCRALALQFCAMTNQEAMYLHIARDTNEADLKQRREISCGTLKYVNAPPVEAAVHGRVLIIEGVEKAERNVLPLLNNLLENREMSLESGDFLTPRHIEGSGTQLVMPSFLVIAIGLPVPRYAGTPLDPPLRSRFAAFTVQSISQQEELETLRELAPARSLSELNSLVKVARALRKEGLPRISEESLQAIARILQVFENTATLLGTLQLAFPYTLLPMPEAAAREVWEVVKDLPSATSDAPLVLEVTAAKGEQDVQLCRVRIGCENGNIDIASAPCGKSALEWAALLNLPKPQGEALARLVQGHCALQDIVVVGERGVGKSHLIHTFARLLGYRVRTMFCFKEMAARDLLTHRSTDADGNTEWKWGPLLQAAIHGDIAVLDGIHRLPKGLLAAAAGRLVMDRALDLPDGRLVPPEQYFALLHSGHTEDSLGASNIHPVHPAFRIICTAEPPERLGQMDWLNDEMLVMFLYLGMRPLADNDHRELLQGALQPSSLDGLLALASSFQTAALKEPNRYRPLKLSTRRLLQIGRYAGASTGDEGEALGRVLRPPFALLPETAQKNIAAMIGEATKKGLPEVGLHVKKNATADATDAKRRMASVSEEKRKRLEAEAVAVAEGKTNGKEIAEEKERVERELKATVTKQRSEWLESAKNALVDLGAKQRPRAERPREPAVVKNGSLSIGRISTPLRKPEHSELVPNAPFVEIPQHLQVMQQMLLDWTIGHHILLIGPQGVGKNKVADKLLELMQAEREYIQLHRDSTVSSLVSAPSLVGGTLIWGDSPLLRAIKHGRVLVVDEADKAPLEVVCVLKALVEDREYALPDGRLVSQRSQEGDTNTIVPHEGFRVIVLANRPGYPFLGNNFYSECGDVFAALVVESPDLHSEAMLLKSYAPSVVQDKLTRLLALFTELRLRVEEGVLLYPYSTRELVKIVQHLEFFPADSVDSACRDVFAFDLQDGSGALSVIVKIAAAYHMSLQIEKIATPLRGDDSLETSLQEALSKHGAGLNQRVEEADFEENNLSEKERQALSRRRTRFTSTRIGFLGSQSKEWGFDVGHVIPFSGGHGLIIENFKALDAEQARSAVVSILNAEDYYSILNASRDATVQSLQNSYIQVATTVHPDFNHSKDAEEAFQMVAKAWSVLRDKEARAEYNDFVNLDDSNIETTEPILAKVSNTDASISHCLFMSLEDALASFANAKTACPNTLESFKPVYEKVQRLVDKQTSLLVQSTIGLSNWIFDCYNSDRDEFLNLQEMKKLTEDTGNELDDDIWPALNEQVGCTPALGLTKLGFHRLYTDIGIGDITEDYWILRDCLHERHVDPYRFLLDSVLSTPSVNSKVVAYRALGAMDNMHISDLCRCYVWIASKLHSKWSEDADAALALDRATFAFALLLHESFENSTNSSANDPHRLLLFAVATCAASAGDYFSKHTSAAAKLLQLLEIGWKPKEEQSTCGQQIMCDWMSELYDIEKKGFWEFADAERFMKDLNKDEFEEDLWPTLLEQVDCGSVEKGGLTAGGLRSLYTDLGLGDITEDYWKLHLPDVSRIVEQDIMLTIFEATRLTDILGVVKGSPVGDLRRGYLWRAAAVHPLANESPLAEFAFRRLSLAWAVLSKEDLWDSDSIEFKSMDAARRHFEKKLPSSSPTLALVAIDTEKAHGEFIRAVENSKKNHLHIEQHSLVLASLRGAAPLSPLAEEQKSGLLSIASSCEALTRLLGNRSESSNVHYKTGLSTSVAPNAWIPWVPSPRRGLGLQRTVIYAEAVKWMAKKVALKQDMFLLGPPGSLCRTLAFQFCAMTNQEAMYIHIARDTNESDLKQRREISNGSLHYINAAPVEAAINGRVLIIEGVEKAERNVLPLLNNLLENREMALESGEFLTPRRMQDSNNFFVRPGFLVIAIGLPVPRYAGTPLDPPLRSRFAAFSLASLSSAEELQTLSSIAPSQGQLDLTRLVKAANLLRKERLPRLSEESLQAVARVIHLFKNSASLGSALRMAYPQSMLALDESVAKDVISAFAGLHDDTSAKVLEVEQPRDSNISLCTVRVQGLSGTDTVSAPCGQLTPDFKAIHALSDSQGDAASRLMQGHCAMQDLMIVAERGVGKTHLIKAFARLLGYNVRTVFCFKEMSARELLTRRGTDKDGNTEWQWGPLLQAAVSGDIAVLDGIHRLPHGLLSAAVGRLVADRTLDLPDGRLIPIEHYLTLLHSGYSKKDLHEQNIHPVHPAFRIICTAEPPQKLGPMCWLSDELLALFLFIPLPALLDSEHRKLLKGQLDTGVVSGLLRLGAAFESAARSDPATFRPMLLSTRRLLQVGRYAAAGTNSIEESLSRVLRPPFALLPETAQRKVLAMVSDARKSGLPHIELTLRQTLEAEAAAGKQVAMPEEVGNALKDEAIGMVFGYGNREKILQERKHHEEENIKAKKKQRVDRFKEALYAVRALRKGRPEGEDVAIVSEGVLRIGKVKSKVLSPKRPELVPEAPFVEIPQHQEVLRQMLLDWTIGNHMLLLGPQGVGKNKLADRLLQLLQAEREYTQLHRDTTVSSLVSAPSLVGGAVIWGDSPLVRALRFGRVLVLDEADKAPLEVVCVLKALVEDGEFALPDGRLVTRQGDASNPNIIVPSDGFRVVVLANRPGFPFLGNDFFRECGDIFSALIVESPDLQSEAMLLRSYGPSVEDEKVARLLALFAELRHCVEQGTLLYPYSTRELVKIVTHLETFPDDQLDAACLDVFAFDLQEGSGVAELLKRTADSHRLKLVKEQQRIKSKQLEQRMKIMLGRRRYKLKPDRGTSQHDYDSDEDWDDEWSDWEEGEDEWENWFDGYDEDDLQQYEAESEEEEENAIVNPGRARRFAPERIGNLGSQSKGWGFKVGNGAPFTGGFGLSRKLDDQKPSKEHNGDRTHESVRVSISQRQLADTGAVASVLAATDNYQALRSARDAQESELRKSYLKIALRVHPHRNGHPDAVAAFSRVADAWLILRDEESRRSYDASLFAIADGIASSDIPHDESSISKASLEEALGVFHDVTVASAEAFGTEGNDPSFVETLFRAQRMVKQQQRKEHHARAVSDVLKAPNYYSALQASEKESYFQLQKNYLQVAVRVHPTRNTHRDAKVAFVRASAAWMLLSEEESRLTYDLDLRSGLADDVVPEDSLDRSFGLVDAYDTFKQAALAISDAVPNASEAEIESGNIADLDEDDMSQHAQDAKQLIDAQEDEASNPEHQLSPEECEMSDWIFERYDVDLDGFLNLQETKQLTRDTGDELTDDMWHFFNEHVECDPKDGITRVGLRKVYSKLGSLDKDYKALQALATQEADPESAAIAAVLAAKDHYAVLGARWDATTSELRKSYLKIALRVHPDKNQHVDAKIAFQRVADAWAILGNAEERRRYDEWLHGRKEEESGFVPEATADAFAEFARAAREASAGGSKDSFAESLRQAQQLAKTYHSNQEDRKGRPISEEQRKQALAEMEQVKGEGIESGALAGLMAGGHSKKQQDKFQKELREEQSRNNNPQQAQSQAKPSPGSRGDGSSEGGAQDGAQMASDQGASGANAALGQRSGAKRRNGTKGKGKQGKGSRHGHKSRVAEGEDTNLIEGVKNESTRMGDAGDVGVKEGSQSKGAKKGVNDHQDSRSPDEPDAAHKSETQPSAGQSQGKSGTLKAGSGNGGVSRPGGEAMQGKGGSGKGPGAGKEGKGGKGGKGEGGIGTPSPGAASISKTADPRAKVWRPGDLDTDRAKGQEELNAHELFDEDPISDVTAPTLNYAESSTYDTLKMAVATQVEQMRELLRNHEAKEKEREWKRGLPDGELDDLRLVEAACGDQNVFRRRQDSKNAALLASKPKRILIACDLSPSMAVLDKVDDRLRRMQEALVFIFESFTGFSQKYDYMITGFNAGGFDRVFVPWARPPSTATQRLKILDTMVNQARHGPPGDGTLAGTEWAIKEVRKTDGDEYFVFIISDAELTRYDISPEEWNKLLMADSQVNAYAIIISMSSSETRSFLEGIDQGHGFACQQRDELAGIFKKVFSETLTKDDP